MNTETRQHIFRETLVSAFINSVFSFGITLLLLGGNEIITGQALVIDALPQSFFVTFFGVFIPTLLTRKKIRAGKLATLPFRKTWLPGNAFLRAVLMGVMAGVAGGLLHLLVLSGLQIEHLEIGTVYVYKTLYGATFSLVVTPLALLMVLKETGNTL